MDGALVVVSWWSNCLALACLQRLVAHTSSRIIYVVQVGKSAAQKARFRSQLPPGVTELFYPDQAPAEHSRVLTWVCLDQLRTSQGLWLVDHDLFVDGDYGAWLTAADEWLAQNPHCLCLPTPRQGPAVTQPTFWLSPARWPAGIASFDPIPFQALALARRPDLFRHNGELRMPAKDTLVQARDELALWGLVAHFPLTPQAAVGHPLTTFPDHWHLGGLSLFTGPPPLPAFRAWMTTTVDQFTAFYQSCASAQLAIEEPELRRRFQEFHKVLYSHG
jgi:hypothetical protein